MRLRHSRACIVNEIALVPRRISSTDPADGSFWVGGGENWSKWSERRPGRDAGASRAAATALAIVSSQSPFVPPAEALPGVFRSANTPVASSDTGDALRRTGGLVRLVPVKNGRTRPAVANDALTGLADIPATKSIPIPGRPLARRR